ncbi:MAG: LPS export ABC transporter periplasmic protein LptC [Bacteroidales bacterium]|nr:LPS export ABC transporter periplasmic protein LptC [Bacteroidales bacterium]
MLATLSVVAGIAFSCKGRLGEADPLDIRETPLQTVDNMFAVKSDKGRVDMRLEAPVMESYDNDSIRYELFPEGLSVYTYTPDGLLETLVLSDCAKHVKSKRGVGDEKWSAFGNVVVHNVLRQETMETDTIYWDQGTKEIYTDCYVKMYSPDGFMQGYGMRTDDRARNSILHKPFNSYGKTVQDTTKVVIDSVNFIGPFPKK